MNARGCCHFWGVTTQIRKPLLASDFLIGFCTEVHLTVKGALRKLYKKVHPDLFHDFPTEKDVNEKSFKLLQDYLHQARSGDPRSPAARTPYNFVFYLRTAAAKQAEPTEQKSLNKVSVVLPPPPAGPGPDLSPVALKGLSKLLVACGIPQPITGEYVPPGGGSGPSLAPFLQQAGEVIRQHESGSVAASVKVANIRGALRLARQLTVIWEDRQVTPMDQVQHLQRLAVVLDGMKGLRLEGCQLVFGRGTRLDSLGQMWLDPAVQDEAWALFLEQVDIRYALQLRHTVKSMRHLEATVAAALGAAIVYTTPAAMTSTSYRSLLEGLAALSGERGPVLGGQLREVPLMILPAPQGPPAGAQQDVDRCGVNRDMGYVHVAMDMTPQEVYEGLRLQGLHALAITHRNKREQSELEALRDRARSVLKLRRLLWDDALPADKVQAALKRLTYHAEELMTLTDGLSLRIAHGNAVSSDKTVVDIPWDFRI